MNVQSVNGALPNSVVAARQGAPAKVSAVPEALLAKAAATITQQAPPPTRDVQASRQQLDEAVNAVRDFVNSVNNSLSFSIDDDTGKTVVKVIDASTKEVIKQFPSEEMLAMARALNNIKGLLLQQKA
ncbi:MAG: flagellar protein FlaG [Propionivibrio sp.]|uniref:Flagellar protein FlaG n=1 Tax=Candidatus Propionivibrio dominans TaxID=2954373 RepID=A0A9D7FG54_9RHOO|nr:flagellar protein FlaG [Candidatus Propionivibrio dominans]MBL0166828.1 flagellar protein FlaG [Propionivibrio sp.]